MGGGIPDWVNVYVDSWKKVCSDYEFVLWNEANYEFPQNSYIREAAAQKRWAFVSDYARLDIIYNHGGIYLDTDVEVIKSLEPLREYEAFIGYGSRKTLATGLGFGAVKNHPMVKEMLDEYEDKHFINGDGVINDQPCTVYNTAPYIKYGLKQDNSFQIINGVAVLPMEFLSGKDLRTGIITITDNTYSIHHYTCSGHVGYGKQMIEMTQKIRVRFGDEKDSSLSKLLIWAGRKYWGMKWHMKSGGIKDVIQTVIKKIKR